MNDLKKQKAIVYNDYGHKTKLKKTGFDEVPPKV